MPVPNKKNKQTVKKSKRTICPFKRRIRCVTPDGKINPRRDCEGNGRGLCEHASP